MKKNLEWLSLIFGISILFILVGFNLPEDSPDNVYSQIKTPKKVLDNLKISFEEVSKNLGIEYYNWHTDQSGETHYGGYPSVSVIDINLDGYMDIFIPATLPQKNNVLFINQNGKTFKEEAKKYGLDRIDDKTSFSFAAFADFNQDGLTDLLLTRFGCHELLLRKSMYKFEKSSSLLNGYCSYPDGINIFDFNNDNRLDILFGNFLSQDHRRSHKKALWGAKPRYDNKTGGHNHLLMGLNTGEFKKLADDLFVTGSYTHAVGIDDVNNDGWNDVFFSNDFAHDQLFINNKATSFIDKTNQYIPLVEHGFSGMNAEFVDFNEDGLIDLYISNLYKPPFSRSYSLLWQKKDNQSFVSKSKELGVANCGFAWGAKFADFDNDGDLDLAVVNGRRRSFPKDGKKPKSLWYKRVNASHMPRFLKKYYHNKIDPEDYNISSHERSCFFINQNGMFYDVANEVGFNDNEEGKGLALIDFDNDGRVDIATVSFRGKARLYKNKSKATKRWFGLSLIDKNGHSTLHGAKINITLSGKRDIVRTVYPLHGYRAQNDPRNHFTLKENEKITEIIVTWPDRTKSKFGPKEIKLQTYNKLYQR